MENKLMNAPANVATTAIAKYTKVFGDIVSDMGVKSGLTLSQTQRMNVTIGCQQIYKVCADNKIDTKALNQSQVSQVLFNLAVLNLNPSASPRQCYFTIRKNKTKNDKGEWIETPTLELGIEGDGNDALVRKYGVGVKSLSAPFIVRENDEFTFPYFDGEKMVAPTWKPKSLTGKAILVFYVLKKDDGTIEYPMAARESVATNLKAHINNNLFGVDDKTKNAILKKIEPMTLEELLNDESLRNVSYEKYDYLTKTKKEETKNLISPAWTSAHSKEEMIIRKMRNNCLKKYPKNFDNAFLADAYESTFENNNTKINISDAVDAEYEIKQNSEPVSSVIPVDDDGIVSESNNQVEQNSNSSSLIEDSPY